MRKVLLAELKRLPHVTSRIDAYGNLIATYRKGKKPARYVLGAHMDHPAWVRDDKADDGWTFLGWVPDSYLDQPANRKRRKIHRDFATWDVETFAYRDGRVHGVACDDLIGCATILSVLSELGRLGIDATVHGVFTRAEEVGFLGADELAKTWPFPKSTTFLSLETSTPRGGAEHGKGPVIRVGDRLSVFDDVATGMLVATAAAAKIPHQRVLLDGGSCEATMMMAHGIPSAGISILLGNYHNLGPRNRIEAEFVDLSDVKALIKLLLAVVEKPAPNPRATLRKRIGALAKKNARHRKQADRSR